MQKERVQHRPVRPHLCFTETKGCGTHAWRVRVQRHLCDVQDPFLTRARTSTHGHIRAIEDNINLNIKHNLKKKTSLKEEKKSPWNFHKSVNGTCVAAGSNGLL